MPTVFALVMLTILVGAGVVGIVVWVRQQQARKVRQTRRLTSEAPYEENTAAAQHRRQTDGRGWF